MKKFKYIVLFALALTLGILQGCGGDTAQKDLEITDSVNSQLNAEPSLATPTVAIITVDTRDGVVTLMGTVENEDQATIAKRIAESVDGVKRVDSNLRIEPKATVTTPMPQQPAPNATTPGTTQGTTPSVTPSSPVTSPAQTAPGSLPSDTNGVTPPPSNPSTNGPGTGAGTTGTGTSTGTGTTDRNTTSPQDQVQ